MEFSLDLATESLRATPAVLRALFDDRSDAWLHAREAQDAWSPYQVCGHLLHIEENDWIDRARFILERGPDVAFPPVDREAGFSTYAGWSVDRLVDRFADVRAENVKTLGDLVQPADLDREGRHPAFGVVTLSQLLATWVTHDLNHLHQIVKTMAKEYGEAVGPWRAFLPVIDAP